MSYENLKTKYEMACETVHPPAIEPYRYFNRTCFYRTEKLEMSPEESKAIQVALRGPVESAPVPSPAGKVKILIDTDIGTDLDDGIALLYAARLENAEILGITTNYGPAHLRAAIVQKFVETQRRVHPDYPEIPVVPGIRTQLGTHRDIFLHGNEGLGFFTRDQIDALDPPGTWGEVTYEAPDFIAKTVAAHPGEVVIVSIGIPTNIAMAVKRHPEMVDAVKEIVMMGMGGIMTQPKANTSFGAFRPKESDFDNVVQVEPPFELPTDENKEEFVKSGKVICLYPNHNTSGDTMATKVLFDTKGLRIRVIPSATTHNFWLTGPAIEHLDKEEKRDGGKLETPCAVVGTLMREWFKRRPNGNGGGQCPHDPLVIHEAVFGGDEAMLNYVPGTFVIHEWACFGTFVPHPEGRHLLSISLKKDKQWFLDRITEYYTRE